MSGRVVPRFLPPVADSQVAFAVALIEDSGVAERLEGLIRKPTGRKRHLSVRALLVALLLLALDDRPLHLKAATRLLFCRLSPRWRAELGIVGEACTKKAFLARYRQLRYLFHLALSVIDPSIEVKNRVIPAEQLQAMRKLLSESEIAARRARLESVLAEVLDASVRLLTESERAAFDGSVGLDATPVPLYSRGPSKRSGRSASDPDGGWYVREQDHREGEDPATGKPLRKLFWALEAEIVTMGRPPGVRPRHPNLVLSVLCARPGEDPGGAAVRLLDGVRHKGHRAGFLGADRGYTQGLPERFHLPARALGYSLVMDYKETELGRQAEREGALLVEGQWYCPAMPEALVEASRDVRAGRVDGPSYAASLSARTAWRLSRKAGPDEDGYERYSCPAIGVHPRLCCPLRPDEASLGEIPVLEPPILPPKLCTQGSITISPEIGARHRQDLAFGSESWRATYATYRNTIEGLNGFAKDTAHEALAQPARRRVRGIAAQSLFVALLLVAANVRKIAAFRELIADGTAGQLAARARRRRERLQDHLPAP